MQILTFNVSSLCCTAFCHILMSESLLLQVSHQVYKCHLFYRNQYQIYCVLRYKWTQMMHNKEGTFKIPAVAMFRIASSPRSV